MRWGFDADCSVEECAQIHLQMVLQHGILLDLLPLTFAHFKSHLLKMSVGVAACLLSRLHARDSHRACLDGIMFACKGTHAVALGVQEYLPIIQEPLCLIGFGTDLSQGFSVEPGPDSASSIQQWAHSTSFLIFNSSSDGAVGAGRSLLDRFIVALNDDPSILLSTPIVSSDSSSSSTNISHCKHQAIWLNDLDLSESGIQTDHEWYDVALARPLDGSSIPIKS